MKLEYSKISDVFLSKGVIVLKLFIDASAIEYKILFFMCKTSINKKIFFIRVSEKYEISPLPSFGSGSGEIKTEKIKKIDGASDVQLNYMIESFEEGNSDFEYDILSLSELSLDVLHDSKFDSYIYDTVEPVLEEPKVEVEQSKIDSLIKKSLELSDVEGKIEDEKKVEPESIKENFKESSEDEKEENDPEIKSEADEKAVVDDDLDLDDENIIDDLEEFKELPENKAVMNKYTSSFYVCLEISKFFKKYKEVEVESEIVSLTNNLNKRLSKMKERRLKQISEFFMNISKELENKILEFKQQEIKINNDISKLIPHLLNAKTIINKNVSEIVKREAKELYSNISSEVEKLNEKLASIKDESSDLLSKFEIAIEKLKSV